MSTFENGADERVKDVSFTADSISVDLMDGRTITVPLAWYPRLFEATFEQLKKWESCGDLFLLFSENHDFFSFILKKRFIIINKFIIIKS
jgi:hypothetical protein